MLIEQPEARLGSSKVSIHKRAIREVRRINATEVPPASPPLDPKNLLGLGSGGICEGSPLALQEHPSFGGGPAAPASRSPPLITNPPPPSKGCAGGGSAALPNFSLSFLLPGSESQDSSLAADLVLIA